jgi:hypothetical protein
MRGIGLLMCLAVITMALYGLSHRPWSPALGLGTLALAVAGFLLIIYDNGGRR